MTTLPPWAVYAVAFASPLLTFLEVLLTLVLTRRSTHELDIRARREELMRNLRWAVELAADADETRRRVGVDQLVVWSRSDLRDPDDQMLIDAALSSVVRERKNEISELKPKLCRSQRSRSRTWRT